MTTEPHAAFPMYPPRLNSSSCKPAPLPHAVQVGVFRYRVTTDPEVIRTIERQERGACYGGANHRTLTLAVDASTPRDQQRDTLWHEVKHAITNLAAIGDEPLAEEESIARTCSLELLVLRTNPALVAFLLEEDDDAEGEVDGARGDDEQALRGAEATNDRPRGLRLREHEGGQGADERGEGQGQEALGARPDGVVRG